jgi:hypothetical protein
MVGIPGKFGNLSLVRVLHNTNDDITTVTKSVRDRGLVSGASQKADYIALTHIRKTVITFPRLLSYQEVLTAWSTALSITVAMFVPFTSSEDHDFFHHVEMHLRGESWSLDQIRQAVEPLQQFGKNSIRLVKRCTKLDR